jgi:hypothetical protein
MNKMCVLKKAAREGEGSIVRVLPLTFLKYMKFGKKVGNLPNWACYRKEK